MSIVGIPIHIIRKLISEYNSAVQSPATYQEIHQLKWSFNPTENLNIGRHIAKFKTLKWYYKVNYSIILFMFSFLLIIVPLSIFAKLFILTSLTIMITVPVLSQFFFYGLPVLSWVFLFFSSPKIGVDYKPPISVKVLPAMETILYGDDLSNILAASTNTVLDIIAWIPYGLIHFSGPFIVAALIWLFGPPKALRSYGWSFGYMNLTGVLIQQFFPSAPPWYKNLYGLLPADYSFKGSAGGLERIDAILGIDLYSSNFANSPVVFGALPSLHSGCSTMSALWLAYLFPQYTSVWMFYVCWLWWSTMYLTHHYFFDLTCGSALAITFFYLVKFTSLPLLDPKCFCRWSYTKLSYFNIDLNDPLSASNNLSASIELDEYESAASNASEVTNSSNTSLFNV